MIVASSFFFFYYCACYIWLYFMWAYVKERGRACVSMCAGTIDFDKWSHMINQSGEMRNGNRMNPSCVQIPIKLNETDARKRRTIFDGNNLVVLTTKIVVAVAVVTF